MHFCLTPLLNPPLISIILKFSFVLHEVQFLRINELQREGGGELFQEKKDLATHGYIWSSVTKFEDKNKLYRIYDTYKLTYFQKKTRCFKAS